MFHFCNIIYINLSSDAITSLFPVSLQACRLICIRIKVGKKIKAKTSFRHLNVSNVAFEFYPRRKHAMFHAGGFSFSIAKTRYSVLYTFRGKIREINKILFLENKFLIFLKRINLKSNKRMHIKLRFKKQMDKFFSNKTWNFYINFKLKIVMMYIYDI